MSQSSKFYRLQLIDTQLGQMLARLEELEKILSDHTEIDKAEEVLRAAEENHHHEQKMLRQAENSVSEQRIKIEENESSLYSGKLHNPKELQDLQKEVASQKRYLATLEDRQIELMISTEAAEESLKLEKTSFDQTKAHLVEQQAGFVAEKTRLLKEKDRTEIERLAACNALSPQELDLYDQLRKQRRGIAVAQIVDRTCMACGSTLTPALVQSANSPNQFVRCPSCNRILYPG